MTNNELLTLDTIDTPEYLKGDLSDNGTKTVDILATSANPMLQSSRYLLIWSRPILTTRTVLTFVRSSQSFIHGFTIDSFKDLPSQVHPSYPYGNPTSVKHPASRPRIPYDPTSRALFEDMGFSGGGVTGQLRWKELALDQLLPVDEEKEEQKRAAQARKMAMGASNNQRRRRQDEPAPPQESSDEEEEDDEEDEDDDDDTPDVDEPDMSDEEEDL